MALVWPRKPLSKPDPFEEEERDAIVAYFRQKVPFYYPLVYILYAALGSSGAVLERR
jgi:hypothetical protein